MTSEITALVKTGHFDDTIFRETCSEQGAKFFH